MTRRRVDALPESSLQDELISFFGEYSQLTCLEPHGSGRHTLLPVKSGMQVIGYKYQFIVSNTHQVTMEINLDLQLRISQIIRLETIGHNHEALNSLVVQIIQEMLLQAQTSKQIDTQTKADSKHRVSLNRQILATLIKDPLALLIALDDDTFEMSIETEKNLIEQIASIFVGTECIIQWNVLVPYEFCSAQVHPLYYVHMQFFHDTMILTIQTKLSWQDYVPEKEVVSYHIAPDNVNRTSSVPLSQGAVVCLRTSCRRLGFLFKFVY